MQKWKKKSKPREVRNRKRKLEMLREGRGRDRRRDKQKEIRWKNRASKMQNGKIKLKQNWKGNELK